MSSDTDDDFSYLPSLSKLKAIRNKKISIDSDTENKVNFFDMSLTGPVVPSTRSGRFEQRAEKIKATAKDLEVINLDEEVEGPTKNNNSCIILSDEETDITPVNIISTIDNFLKNGKKGKKRGPKAKKKTTRQSKSQNKSANLQSVSFVEPDVSIVENTPDLNEVNYELTVKVFWKSQYLEKFALRRFEKLTGIFQYFSEKENVPENRLLFTIKDRIISKNETPESLNITAATIIEGGILSFNTNVAESKSKDDGRIELKVQTRDRKHPLLISLKPEDKMEDLMCQCAQELKLPLKQLKFYFDGELIKPKDTPESLDLEGGEMIDCKNNYLLLDKND